MGLGQRVLTQRCSGIKGYLPLLDCYGEARRVCWVVLVLVEFICVRFYEYLTMKEKIRYYEYKDVRNIPKSRP